MNERLHDGAMRSQTGDDPTVEAFLHAAAARQTDPNEARFLRSEARRLRRQIAREEADDEL